MIKKMGTAGLPQTGKRICVLSSEGIQWFRIISTIHIPFRKSMKGSYPIRLNSILKRVVFVMFVFNYPIFTTAKIHTNLKRINKKRLNILLFNRKYVFLQQIHANG